MNKSRTTNTIRNMGTGVIVQLINKLMAFTVRIVFIKMLNIEYLGVNGLFTNILTMLSFAELGIGTAIIFNMYKPVAENDKEKIKSLMKLYQKSYNIIGIVVFVLGLCLIPFMNLIIREAPNIKEKIIYIYILFLINTYVSYFFTYKKSIISAHQQESIINRIDSIVYSVKSIVEIVLLFLTRNYIIYLIIEIVSTIMENIIIYIKADKMFPYLKEKGVYSLSKKEMKRIFLNVKSLIMYKFGAVIMTGTDNILISAMVNVEIVGLCSNYTLIINSIKNIITSVLKGITASVGNLNAVGEKEQKEKVFYQLTFINFWMYLICAIAFIMLLNPLIKIWLGEEYVLNLSISIALSISFLIDGLRNPGYTYRITMGLFEKGKITPYIGAITNIFFSIVLCKLWGIVGIFIATSIAQLCSYSWIDPYLIHKYEFKTPFSKYFKKYLIYIAVSIISYLATYGLGILIGDSGIISFILKLIVVCIVPNLIILLFLYRTEEFREIRSRLLGLIKIYKKVRRKKKLHM